MVRSMSLKFLSGSSKILQLWRPFSAVVSMVSRWPRVLNKAWNKVFGRNRRAHQKQGRKKSHEDKRHNL